MSAANFDTTYSKLRIPNIWRPFCMECQDGIYDNAHNSEFVERLQPILDEFFDQLKILGFSDNDSNFMLSNLKIDEINISDFDIKEYDKINNILNSFTIDTYEKNFLSFILSMQFEKLLLKNL